MGSGTDCKSAPAEELRNAVAGQQVVVIADG
jgi:hypothetical protein